MAKNIKAHLIFVGTELLKGKENKYPPLLCREFSKLGIETVKEISVPDNKKIISEEIKNSVKATDIVLVTGGLGPTFDDVTREAAAAALKKKLIFSKKILKQIEQRFLKYKKPMTKNNVCQAYILKKATPIENKAGTAPGQYIKITNGKTKKFITLLPGPLIEWRPMFEGTIKPELIKFFNLKEKTSSIKLNITGIGESAAEELLQPVMQKFPQVNFTILSSPANIRFYAETKDKKTLTQVKAMSKNILGDKIYGQGNDTLESVLGKILKRKKLTLTIAESCTGGLFSHRITETPGSSAYFKGGVISYSNDLKKKLLKVKEKTLKKYGAVSEQTATEMAKGVLKLIPADLSVSITGIAGPKGKTKEKPVGLVYIAIAFKNKKTVCQKHYFTGNRSIIKTRAVNAALNMLKLFLK